VGFGPEERLTYWAPAVQEWLPLAPFAIQQ